MAIFWQARPPQWRPHQRCAAATFYSAKSNQDLASHSGPELVLTGLVK